jgi:hypothetical protein
MIRPVLATAAAALLSIPFTAVPQGQGAGKVSVLRVPDKGIQPQTAVDAKGTVHLIYYQGDAQRGDIFYVHSADGKHFSKPIRVNSHPKSVIAMGNIRGAQLAVGKGGRVHVAWIGSDQAMPRGPNKAMPMLYTRLTDDGTAFEPQRNVIHSAYGLDGGGSVAADPAGNVYVAWHAPLPETVGEANRCVWVAHSADEGKTFAEEKRANAEPTGACGCCGMRVFSDSKGTVYALYRSAEKVEHRDIHLLLSRDHGKSFKGEKVHDWKIAGCPMSAESICEGQGTVFAAWETDGQVYFARIDRDTGKRSAPTAAPGAGQKRRFPVLATNTRGETLLAWSEGVEWGRGGSVAWQAFDKAGNPTAERGRVEGLPAWSLVTAFTRTDGGFTVVY